MVIVSSRHDEPLSRIAFADGTFPIGESHLEIAVPRGGREKFSSTCGKGCEALRGS